ncbi:DUF4269 domain-containing protein [Paenibacillus zeisoli]|uniref:DUF4269 domain-containing protein n=2 Tax=Paenibacillus zeisoli TaxID=2496267 RepID=A0A3S1B921_9BACL|nr:DUF4269 domain-containing protein [Paenibacillus zeisoli]
MTVLNPFDPLLVGTVPIEIDLPTSDLDIICHFQDAMIFRDFLIQEYSKYKDFSVKSTVVDSIERVVCYFTYGKWMVEIFGQPKSTFQQNGYKHMIIEYRILSLLGIKAKKRIIELKSRGIKTEPAFGHLLKIQGDPYKVLLEMYQWNEEQLQEYLRFISIDCD